MKSFLVTETGAMVNENKNDLRHLLEPGSLARVSLAICDLASGYQILVKPDLPFHPASTIKLGVMMEVYHQASQEEFSLDELLPVKNSFLSLADQSEYSLSPGDDSESDLYLHIGEQLSIRNLARRMIVSSSNLATNLLIEKIGAEMSPASCRLWGQMTWLSGAVWRTKKSLCTRLEQLCHCPQSHADTGPLGQAQRGQSGHFG